MTTLQSRVEKVIERGPRTGVLTLRGFERLGDANLRELNGNYKRYCERHDIDYVEVRAYTGSGRWTKKSNAIIVDASVKTPKDIEAVKARNISDDAKRERKRAKRRAYRARRKLRDAAYAERYAKYESETDD